MADLREAFKLPSSTDEFGSTLHLFFSVRAVDQQERTIRKPTSAGFDKQNLFHNEKLQHPGSHTAITEHEISKL